MFYTGTVLCYLRRTYASARLATNWTSSERSDDARGLWRQLFRRGAVVVLVGTNARTRLPLDTAQWHSVLFVPLRDATMRGHARAGSERDATVTKTLAQAAHTADRTEINNND